MEELVVSEENYVAHLKVLGCYYLDSFRLQHMCPPQPIVELQQAIAHLIRNHSVLASSLRDVFSSSSDRAVRMAHLVCAHGIDTSCYSKYIELFHYVRDLLHANPCWFRCWESYLRLIHTGHSDLSFMSLLHKPLARIARYKLYLEAFIGCSNSNITLQYPYHRCLQSLQIINETSISAEEYARARLLNDICDFSKLAKNVTICLQFFGTCVFSSCVQAAWMAHRSLVSQVYAMFVFRHYLVLAQVAHRWLRRLLVAFVVPLLGLRFYHSPSDTCGGIFSRYSLCSKLDFTDSFRRYELLFVAANCSQHETWRLLFHTRGELTSHKCLFKVPATIVPCDLTPAGLARGKTENCYFNALFVVDNSENHKYPNDRKNQKNDELRRLPEQNSSVHAWFTLLSLRRVQHFVDRLGDSTLALAPSSMTPYI